MLLKIVRSIARRRIKVEITHLLDVPRTTARRGFTVAVRNRSTKVRIHGGRKTNGVGSRHFCVGKAVELSETTPHEEGMIGGKDDDADVNVDMDVVVSNAGADVLRRGCRRREPFRWLSAPPSSCRSIRALVSGMRAARGPLIVTSDPLLPSSSSVEILNEECHRFWGLGAIWALNQTISHLPQPRASSHPPSPSRIRVCPLLILPPAMLLAAGATMIPLTMREAPVLA